MDRKEFLKSIGLLSAGAAFIPSEGTIRAAERFSGAGSNDLATLDMATDKEVDFPVKPLRANVKGGPVKVIIIGAGNRGRTYAEYARKFPECMQVVGVSDIRESRRMQWETSMEYLQSTVSATGAKSSKLASLQMPW